MRLGILIGISAILTSIVAFAVGHNPVYEIFCFGFFLMAFSFVFKSRTREEQGI